MQAELEKLEANLGGVADMRRQPEAIFIVDLCKEQLAVREARRLGMPVIALVDTNCDPDEADFVIPGNDDAIRSCGLVVRAIAEAIEEGRQRATPADFAAQTDEPAVVDVRHPDALRLLLDGVLRLLLRADEQDGAAALGEVSHERLRLLQALEGLLQVDDVDAAALAEDEAAHLRVPAARLVTEVDSGFQELSHADCHGVVLSMVAGGTAGGSEVEPGSEAPAPPPALIAG